jgi:hypothetical protein
MSIESRRERRTEKNNFKNFIASTPEEAKYHEAKKRVKRIKGFYTHTAVFIVINLMVVIINLQNLEVGESYFQFKNFQTFLFWGIGLTAHGLSVFMPSWIMGENWEERKIKEFMEKEKHDKEMWQ